MRSSGLRCCRPDDARAGRAGERDVDMSETPYATGERDDDKIVRLTAERLSEALDEPEERIVRTVRDELERWRARARIQTFVPIFAERAAKQRLAG